MRLPACTVTAHFPYCQTIPLTSQPVPFCVALCVYIKQMQYSDIVQLHILAPLLI